MTTQLARYPIFRAYGSCRFMDRAESAASGFDLRIESVWPYLVKLSRKLYLGMSAVERSNYDPEDILSEFWAELRRKDEKYDPSISKYITFAGRVSMNCFLLIRERCRPVHSPRNASLRIRQYNRKRAEGTLTDSCAATEAKLRSSYYGDFGKSVGGRESSTEDASPSHIAECDELKSLTESALVGEIANLTLRESFVIGGLHGLWGRDVRTERQMAAALGLPLVLIALARDSGYAKLRERLAGLA